MYFDLTDCLIKCQHRMSNPAKTKVSTVALRMQFLASLSKFPLLALTLFLSSSFPSSMSSLSSRFYSILFWFCPFHPSVCVCVWGGGGKGRLLPAIHWLNHEVYKAQVMNTFFPSVMGEGINLSLGICLMTVTSKSCVCLIPTDWHVLMPNYLLSIWIEQCIIVDIVFMRLELFQFWISMTIAVKRWH